MHCPAGAKRCHADRREKPPIAARRGRARIRPTIAEFSPGFSHYRSTHDKTECIEGYFGAIAVQIDKKPGGKHAVIEFGTCSVPHGVCRQGRRQIVPVIGNSRHISEGVTIAVRKEEMSHRIVQFM